MPPPLPTLPGVVITVAGVTHVSRFRKSTTACSPSPSVSVDHDTVSPVVVLTRLGALTGPVSTATGGEPNVPSFVTTAAPGGGALAVVNGTVNGVTMPPPAPAGIGVIVMDSC